MYWFFDKIGHKTNDLSNGQIKLREPKMNERHKSPCGLLTCALLMLNNMAVRAHRLKSSTAFSMQYTNCACVYAWFFRFGINYAQAKQHTEFIYVTYFQRLTSNFNFTWENRVNTNCCRKSWSLDFNLLGFLFVCYVSVFLQMRFIKKTNEIAYYATQLNRYYWTLSFLEFTKKKRSRNCEMK